MKEYFFILFLVMKTEIKIIKFQKQKYKDKRDEKKNHQKREKL